VLKKRCNIISIKYSMRDQTCDVISSCACSCNIGKISLAVYNKIQVENLNRGKLGIEQIFCVNSHLKVENDSWILLIANRCKKVAL